MVVQLTESAEDVSRIAFGFMASKALFAGLHLDVFTLLSDGPKTAAEVAAGSKVPINRATTLLTALTSVGLLDRDEDRYSNSPGRSRSCPRGSPTSSATTCATRSISRCIPFSAS